MANYYHEARAHARKLKEMQEEGKRRAERRAEKATAQAEHPLNLLTIDGRPAKLHKNTEQYQAVERMEGMIPWNGQQDNLIDRFDGRALLDFYKEPDPSVIKSKGAEEQKLDKLLHFESFRDVVRLVAKGLSEQEALVFAQKENVELRAAARAAAAAAVAAAQERKGGQHNSNVAGPGAYAAVGFTYNTETLLNDSSDDSSDQEVEEDEEEEAPQTQQQLDQEAEDERLDGIAEQFGISDYSYILHKALTLEGELEEARRSRPRRRMSRKKAAERARRMAGMGVALSTQSNRDWYKDTKPNAPVMADRLVHRRSSPSYEGCRRRSRSRSYSPTRSPRRRREERPRTMYITEFSGPSSRGADSGSWMEPAHASRNEPTRGSSILEALPDRPDPAVLGGALAMPASAIQVQGIKPHELLHRDNDSRERGRDRNRDRDRGRDRSRDGDRDRDRERGRNNRGIDSTKTASSLNNAPKKETPQERLKRIMQAQLNKQVQKDNLAATHKKLQAEKDRTARLQIERAAFRRSPSPPSPRGRDTSPTYRSSHRSRRSRSR